MAEFEADVLGENRAMLEVFAHNGFESHNSLDSGVCMFSFLDTQDFERVIFGDRNLAPEVIR